MAEYLAQLLNSDHSDRQHDQDVLEEYLFQSDDSGSESDTLYYDTERDDTESVALDEEELEMTVDEGISHFQKWKNGCTIALDDAGEELVKCTNYKLVTYNIFKQFTLKIIRIIFNIISIYYL